MLAAASASVPTANDTSAAAMFPVALPRPTLRGPLGPPEFACRITVTGHEITPQPHGLRPPDETSTDVLVRRYEQTRRRPLVFPVGVVV